MGNNCFLSSSKVALSCPSVIKILFLFLFIIISPVLQVLSLFKHPTISKFRLVHLIQPKESSMTGPIAVLRRGDLYIKLIEVALVLVPRQKLIKTITATWKYYSF